MYFQDLNQFLVIALAHLLAVISPGPDFALITRQSFLHGRKSLTKGDPRDIVIIQSQNAGFGYGSTTRRSINDIT